MTEFNIYHHHHYSFAGRATPSRLSRSDAEAVLFQVQWIGLCSVLRPLQHSIGYMGDGFYRSNAPLAKEYVSLLCLVDDGVDIQGGRCIILDKTETLYRNAYKRRIKQSRHL